MTQKLLLDCDPGCDDTIALLLALSHDDIEVVGVTTVVGNTTVENATRNVLSVLEYVGRTDVPVAAGCRRPLVDSPVYAEWIHGPDGLPASVRATLPEPTIEPEPAHAADVIVDMARTHGEDLTVAAVGPSTNLAVALTKEPRLPELVGDVYVMGGALSTTGNVTPMASFNFYVDAPAASRVVQDAFPRVCALDVTEAAWVPLSDLEALDGDDEDYLAVAKEVFRFTEEEVREKFGREGVIASDTVVVADMVADVVEFEPAYVEVDTTGGRCNGATIYDEHGVYDEEPTCFAGVDLDLGAYRSFVLETLASGV